MNTQLKGRDYNFEIGEMAIDIYNEIDGEELRQLSESTKERIFNKIQDVLKERLIQWKREFITTYQMRTITMD
nr:hypothetical protein [Providencia rettgeri]